MLAFSIASFMQRVPTWFRPSPLQSFSCSLRFLACALAHRTAALRSVAESGPRSGVYSTQTLGADLTEQILVKETTGSPEPFFLPGRFSRGWPPAFTLASRIAALRSVTKIGPLVPCTVLSRLRDLTSQAKRPASGPTLAGAGANSGATVIKCGDSPQVFLRVIHACVVQKICG